jgi:hypothetical protein
MNERIYEEKSVSTSGLAPDGGRMQGASDLEDQFVGNRGGAATAMDTGSAPLFPEAEAEALRNRWTDIQAGFVDEPKHAVEDADGLVAEVIKRLAETFAEERRKLEQQWDRESDISTEDLRVALQRYRSFFSRLLTL